MKYRYLSHVLTGEIPVYGGRSSINLNKVKSIPKGDSANISQLTITNHSGTHVEGANHFFEAGRKITDYPAEHWFFKYPQVIRVELRPSEILTTERCTIGINSKTDILFLQSGWTSFRYQQVYSTENPGIAPEVGSILREEHPNIKAIVIDWISISSYQNRPLGREAHKAFLDPDRENEPILIVEDADLSGDLKGLKEAYVFPLRIEDADSAPCTIIGGFYD